MLKSDNQTDFQISDQQRPYGILQEDFIFIFATLAVGVFFRVMLKKLNLPMSYQLFVIITGATIGILQLSYPQLRDYTEVTNIPPKVYLFVIVPIFIFKTALSTDVHTLKKCWSQIFLIVSLIQITIATLSGLTLMSIVKPKWTIAEGILFGFICTPLHALDIPYCITDLRQTKHVVTLLEGEAVFGNATALTFISILLFYIKENGIHLSRLAAHLAQALGGGLVIGVVLGKILAFVFNMLYSDTISIITFSFIVCVSTFYLAVRLNTAALMAIAISGIIAGKARSRLSTEVENRLLQFWDSITFTFNTIILMVFSILIMSNIYPVIHSTHVALIFVSYIVLTTCRFIAFYLASPFLIRFGYGLSFNTLNVIVWAANRGVLPIIYSLFTVTKQIDKTVSLNIQMYTFAFVTLSLLINFSSVGIVLRLLGISELSLAQKANMNNSLKHLQTLRDKAIAMLKRNRFYADANWPIVSTATEIQHPYRSNLMDKQDHDYLGYRVGVCPECKKEVRNDPTPKEIIELTREARQRILKAKKISYARQYENGMLSREGARILSQAVEIAIDSNEALIELDGLHKLFSKEGYFLHFTRKLLEFFFKDTKVIQIPRRYYRRICYRIVTHTLFECFITLCIILNGVTTYLELQYQPPTSSPLSTKLKIFNFLFLITYSLEFFLKVMGYSWIHFWNDGVKTYFRSAWNCFDFFILIICFFDVGLDIIDTFSESFNTSESAASTITKTTKLLRIVRLLRLLRILKVWYPQVMKYCNTLIDERLAFAYDVGKGFVTAEEEVYNMLTYMVDNTMIREDCRLRIESDRLAVIKQLAIFQKSRPWISVTVKTRQAIRSILNILKDAAWELKLSGWVDEREYGKILGSLNMQLRSIKDHVTAVHPSAPKTIFAEVSWMGDDDQIVDFLYENVVTKMYEQGDVICQEGALSEGIFIIVTGLFKLSYVPNKEVFENLYVYGALPITDYICSERFDEPLEDYILSGSCVGELSTLTNRPYNCNIVASTSSQVYVLKRKVIQEAIVRSSDPITGLEARIWKSVSIRLATALLMESPTYQSVGQEKIHQQLERAFVPNISNYKVFGLNDFMEDVILIEGVVIDYNTRDCYVAPCYLPRNVQRLFLPKSSDANFETTIETKLLIIPAKGIDQLEIMEKGEEISEMVSVQSSKCLQHVIQSRAAKGKKRRTLDLIRMNQPLGRGGIAEVPSRFTTKSAYSKASGQSGMSRNSQKRNDNDQNNII